MGLPILALSELIPFSRCAPADRCEAINRYHRPIVFPLRFRLNRNRKAEVNMNITPIEKVAYIAKTQPPGSCAWPMLIGRCRIATLPCGRLNQ
jgi:hypothetical protein